MTGSRNLHLQMRHWKYDNIVATVRSVSALPREQRRAGRAGGLAPTLPVTNTGLRDRIIDPLKSSLCL